MLAGDAVNVEIVGGAEVSVTTMVTARVDLPAALLAESV
jgi:hypothetical protein